MAHLAYAVGADEAEHLAGTGHRQTVEFEGVGTVPVSCVALQVLGQVDDVDGFEGALGWVGGGGRKGRILMNTYHRGLLSGG